MRTPWCRRSWRTGVREPGLDWPQRLRHRCWWGGQQCLPVATFARFSDAPPSFWAALPVTEQRIRQLEQRGEAVKSQRLISLTAFYDNENRYRSVVLCREACGADQTLHGTKAGFAGRTSSGRGRSLATRGWIWRGLVPVRVPVAMMYRPSTRRSEYIAKDLEQVA